VKEIQALNEAKVVRTTASHLSGEQLRDAEAALQRLQGRYSLVMPADWLLRTFRDTLTQKTFAESFPIFLEERRAHLRRTTYQDYRTRLTSFAYVAPRFSVNDPSRWVITLQERGQVAGVFAAVVG
jgi:hypothetical protein